MAFPQIITITENAKARIEHLLSLRNKPSVGIRIGIRSGGCNGLTYTVEYADNITEFDTIVEYEGVKVLIDRKAELYLLGTQMDYVEGKMKSGFTFTNPNVKGQCGCGESFHV
ncbi:MAG: iron-sulfur cluster assembly accessory protein [Sphingobacteriia bacterium]|nr:iron-sulfur cluster assembly accessory protein [Sphingobacteriia bacterium]